MFFSSCVEAKCPADSVNILFYILHNGFFIFVFRLGSADLGFILFYILHYVFFSSWVEVKCPADLGFILFYI